MAEARGWKRKGRNKIWICPTGGWDYLNALPNYPLDLNACAEFEATLTGAERFTYLVELNKLSGDEPSSVWATARQRCLAYLKTKGILP